MQKNIQHVQQNLNTSANKKNSNTFDLKIFT